MTTAEMKQIITYANKSYREGNPTVTDQEFDELLELYHNAVSDEEYSSFRDELNEGVIETGKKVHHPFVMGSLDKVKIEEPDKILSFIYDNIKTTMNVSAKVDGISCRLHYVNGLLTTASTRGDGHDGEDISDKIVEVRNIPTALTDSITVDIRGELVIYRDTFADMTGFANPRNACAGIMNRKDWNRDDVNRVSFVAYTILGPEYRKDEQFSMLKNWGFTVSPNWNIVPNDDTIVDRLMEMASDTYDFETDGLVICDSSYHNEDKYRPDTCVAVKTNMLVAKTRIVDVVWQGPHKCGEFTPVAVLDPVEIGGSIITRATLNNLDFISKIGVSYGSIVEILKSGDIIPKITRVIESQSDVTPIEPPETCPCCGSTLERGEIELKCPNPECSDKTTYQVMYFIKNLGIDYASFKTLNNFHIHTIQDLLSFRPDNFGRNGQKLYTEMKNKMFNRSRRDLVSAMNFDGLSEKLLSKIFDFYGFENAVRHSNLKGLPVGIGDKMMYRFTSAIDSNMKIVDSITSDFRYSYTGGDCQSLSAPAVLGSICFTGTLASMGRKEATNLAERNGYEVKSTVTEGLTYLVMADPHSNSTKAQKARKLGTTVIGEDEFISMMNSNGINVDDL